MALIERYHVVADFFPVDPDWTVAIIEGDFVDMAATGFVARASGAAGERAIGVSGDTLNNAAPATAANLHTPYSAPLTVNAAGGQQWTQNRVSDGFNETLASSQLTVYHSGGRFFTTQYEVIAAGVPVAYAIGNPLYVNATGLLTTNVSASAQIVGTVLAAPAQYPSGVPGTAVQQSMSLGTYLDFKLEI